MCINMKKLGLFVLALTIYVGCSDVKFSHNPSDTCKDFNQSFGEGACQQNPKGFNEYSYSVQVGSVDILFVVDNSGSMYEEQVKMAEKFPNFLNSISSLDWQIAITTTDIYKTDGRFLTFPNGSDVISRDTPNVESEFRETIRRQETLDCDRSGYKKCPSGDERGIYAVNRAIDRGHNKFFNSQLAIVFLSDENERSNGGAISGYELQEYDLPVTLVSKVKTQLGEGKIFSVHSIIVRSGDTACFAQQNSQSAVRGYYGTLYEQLSHPSDELKALGGLVSGHMGSICAVDYGPQMGDIGSKIADNSLLEKLPCHPETPDDLNVTFSPSLSFDVNLIVDENNILTAEPGVPAGTTADITVNCPLNI